MDDPNRRARRTANRWAGKWMIHKNLVMQKANGWAGTIGKGMDDLESWTRQKANGWARPEQEGKWMLAETRARRKANGWAGPSGEEGP